MAVEVENWHVFRQHPITGMWPDLHDRCSCQMHVAGACSRCRPPTSAANSWGQYVPCPARQHIPGARTTSYGTAQHRPARCRMAQDVDGSGCWWLGMV